MNRHFDKVDMFKSNLYIVDYTNKTNSFRGVEFFVNRPIDIRGLLVVNSAKLEFFAVNFECNKLYNNRGKMISQCECMCTPNSDVRSWMMFVEMKYGKTKNDNHNFRRALRQLESTHLLLKKRGVVKDHRVYYVVSLPQSKKRPPFESFMFNAHELAKIKREKGVIIKGTNKIEVIDGLRLR